MGSGFVRDAASRLYGSVDDGIAATVQQLATVTDIANRTDGEGDIACLTSICLLLDVQVNRKGAGLEALTHAQKLGSRSRAYVPCPGDGLVGALMRLDAATRLDDPRASQTVIQPALAHAAQHELIPAAIASRLRAILQLAALSDYRLLLARGVVRPDIATIENTLTEFADALEYHDDPRYGQGYEQRVVEMAQRYRDARAELQERDHSELLPDVESDEDNTFKKLTTRELQDFIRDMVYDRMPSDGMGDVDWDNEDAYKRQLNALTPEDVVDELREEFNADQSFDSEQNLNHIRSAIEALQRASGADDTGGRDDYALTVSSDERSAMKQGASSLRRSIVTWYLDDGRTSSDTLAPTEIDRSIKDELGVRFDETFARVNAEVQETRGVLKRLIFDWFVNQRRELDDLRVPEEGEWQALKNALGDGFQSTVTQLKNTVKLDHDEAEKSLRDLIGTNHSLKAKDVRPALRNRLSANFEGYFDRLKAITVGGGSGEDDDEGDEAEEEEGEEEEEARKPTEGEDDEEKDGYGDVDRKFDNESDSESDSDYIEDDEGSDT